jgi:Flp pilus assembly protein TadD
MCKKIGAIVTEAMDAANAGDFATSEELLHQALEAAAKKGSAIHEAKLRNNLGITLLMAGRTHDAAGEFTTALERVTARIGNENPLFERIQRNHAKALAA